MIGYVGAVAGGMVLGVILDRIALSLASNRKLEKEKILEECFGKPMSTGAFTLSEARDWIQAREALLQNGGKAAILKVNSETLRGIGKDLDVGNSLKNYLLIAVVDGASKSMVDSVLIKYEALDEALEEALKKGNGVLVVEG